MEIKLKQNNYKIVKNILRICKAALGAIGMTFVVTDYKWTGVIILVLAAVCNESLDIIKETEEQHEN
jgi:hypothetical protein